MNTYTKYFASTASLVLFLAIFVAPSIVLGQGTAGNLPPAGDAANLEGANTITDADKLQNPLGGDVKTIPQFIAKILEIITKIGTPIIVIMIIYSGFLFVWARGNEEKLTKAKSTLMWTLVGAALMLGAWILAQAIVGTVNQLK
ncbi:MAG: pilin [Candidatus Pacebacteria bacterium]|jgi:hypothetical protein|nr:pilin [Candidatus Paceibacterota bacterium]